MRRGDFHLEQTGRQTHTHTPKAAIVIFKVFFFSSCVVYSTVKLDCIPADDKQPQRTMPYHSRETGRARERASARAHARERERREREVKNKREEKLSKTTKGRACSLIFPPSSSFTHSLTLSLSRSTLANFDLKSSVLRKRPMST